MRQRVMLAMAIASDPALIIADEPTSALDVTVQAQLLELVLEIRERLGVAVLLITHDLGVVASAADRVAVMYAGKIVELGPAEDVLERPAHPYTAALLAAIPRPDLPDGERLVSIPGTPPQAGALPIGCPFRPRCNLAIERCDEEPPLLPVGDGHTTACWVGGASATGAS